MTPDGKELTWRGVALGMALTFLFTAANMYLGLKVGLTIATSIPAAVISMAFLGLFSGSNIRENNIVQTVCSAAGAMASVIFILPSLVIIGWWTGFPFWTSFLVCAAGGVLGVLFTIPLRRALVTQSDLPYPEGVAAAEVLKVGADMRAEQSRSARRFDGGDLWRACVGRACDRDRHAAGRRRSGRFFPHRRQPPQPATAFSFSLALVGAGHLVGISVGLAMLLGILIAWAGAVPLITAMTPHAWRSGELRQRHLAQRCALHRRRRDGGGGDLVPASHRGAHCRRAQGDDADARWRARPHRPNRPRHVLSNHPGDWRGLDSGHDLAGMALQRRGRS